MEAIPIARLVWVLPHATPYNIYLLGQLCERLHVPSEAIYRWPEISSHPWTCLPPRRFAWRVVDHPGGRDGALERCCALDPATLVVFGGWRDATILPALMARARARLPYAFWTDTPKVSRHLPRRLLNRLFVGFARRAVTTLTTGTSAMERYRVMGVPADRLENFPYVVDSEHFGRSIPMRTAFRDGGTVRFVLNARLVDRLKGHSVALRALQRVRAQVGGRRLDLVFAGTGPDEGQLRARAKELGVDEAVQFAGWVEYADLPALLASADALLLPSYWEPYGVAVAEAMAAGLPVVCSDACGVRDCIAHAENGLVHPAGDAIALAEDMRALATDPALRARLGDNALATSRVYGIDHCVTVLRSVLERLASATGDLAKGSAVEQVRAAAS